MKILHKAYDLLVALNSLLCPVLSDIVENIALASGMYTRSNVNVYHIVQAWEAETNGNQDKGQCCLTMPTGIVE